MEKIIEKRIVNDYIKCTGIRACIYIPRGIFSRTWFIKKSDGTVMECRVKEFGHCLVDEDGKNKDCRSYVCYQTPEGGFINYNKYGGFYLYPSYDDAVRCECYIKPYIHYEVNLTNYKLYDEISLKSMFRDMGFCNFEYKGAFSDLFQVKGYKYENGNLCTVIIKSTMWIDKDGFHIEPIVPDGVFKTKEEAYASNMPKLVTFDDMDEEDSGQDEKDKRIAELEEIIRNAQNELNKINSNK